MSVILEGKNEFLDQLEGKKEAASVAAMNIVTKGRLIVARKARKVFKPFPGGRVIAKTSGRTRSHIRSPTRATLSP